MGSRICCLIITVNFAATATAQDVLLIPDGIDRHIFAFSPVDGAIIDLDFVPADPPHMMSPFNAVASGRGTIFVSDNRRIW